MKKSLETKYCIECGSSNVSSQAWVNQETLEIEEYIGGCFDISFNFCNNCNENTQILSLPELWELFADVPINDNDEIERPFLYFEKGASRFDVWHWFDERCPNGLAVDLMGETPNK